jgi:hypothetical protein
MFVDCIDVVQDRSKWQALANTTINLWVPYKMGNFLTN